MLVLAHYKLILTLILKGFQHDTLSLLLLRLEMGRVFLRVFTHQTSVTSTHSFLVGSQLGGLSERVGSFLIHDEVTTFSDLRLLIEVFNDNGMNRRTALFQDVLHTMMTAFNPHQYPIGQLATYRFGVMAGIGGREVGDVNITRDYDKMQVPSLISEDVESEPICTIVHNLNDIDLIIVPISQIRPQDQAVSLQQYIEVAVVEANKKKKELDYINSIDLSKYSPDKIAAANQRIRREEEDAMAKAE